MRVPVPVPTHGPVTGGGPWRDYPGRVPIPSPRRVTSLLLAVVGGVLTDLGFPGVGWWPTTILGLALLLLALGRDSARWNALVGLVWGLAFFGPHITWTEGAVGPVPWLALTLAESGFVALLGVGWSWARRGAATWYRARLQIPVFAVLLVASEEARAVAPFGGFPWGRIAFAHPDSPLGRWAWVGGAPAVTFVVALVAGCVALLVARLARLDLGAASGWFLLAVALTGSGLLLPLETRAETGTLAVGAVQGNVPNQGLDSFLQEREVLENHVSGTHALLEEVGPGDLDVVLWPENGSDIDPRVDADAGVAVQGAAAAIDAPVLVGTQEFPADGGRYNVLLVWDPQDGPGQTYAKQHPAPFAEYVPMRDLARRFSDDVDRVRTDMLPGTEPGLIGLAVPRLERTVDLGVAICFEVAYDDIVRDAVELGAEVLVIPTNNATFGQTDESTQQLAMSRLRAIEHGRATVQVSTVGVSAVIAPNGVVREQTGLFTAERMVAELPLRTSLTPATRWGDELTWALRALGVVVVVAGMAGAVRRPRAVREADA